MDDKELLHKMRAAEFRENNGYVLRVINILRHTYEKLASVKSALEDMDEGDFLDSINFLSEEGYIRLRSTSGKVETALADADYRDLEAKVTAKGIRLLGGELIDKLVRT